MRVRAFTLIESAVILVVTSILLGTSFYLLNLNKPYQDFEISKLRLSEDLRRAQDLSFKRTTIILNNNTSSVCGVGLLISSSTKEYIAIAYATSSQGSIDCYYISSSTPEVFDFTSSSPTLFVTNGNDFTDNINNQLIIKHKLKIDEIKIGTSSLTDFNSTSIMFIHPYGDVLIFYDGKKVEFDKDFNIYLKYLDRDATVTITKPGQVILK